MMSTHALWLLFKPTHLMLYGLILGWMLWRWRGRSTLLSASVLALVVCAVLPVAAALMMPLERRFPRPAELTAMDGIIVLAGAERAKLSEVFGEPQFELYTDRLTTFLLLARRFPNAQLVHSGAGTDPDMSQSAVAARFLLEVGIVPPRVVFEDRSRNTAESARVAYDLVKPAAGSRWLLVTSAFHMPRSVGVFRAAGWDVTAYPTDYKRVDLGWSSLTANLTHLDMAAHEWVGLLYYRLRGYSQEIFPGPS